jgi:hypothetical protein
MTFFKDFFKFRVKSGVFFPLSKMEQEKQTVAADCQPRQKSSKIEAKNRPLRAKRKV